MHILPYIVYFCESNFMYVAGHDSLDLRSHRLAKLMEGCSNSDSNTEMVHID